MIFPLLYLYFVSWGIFPYHLILSIVLFFHIGLKSVQNMLLYIVWGKDLIVFHFLHGMLLWTGLSSTHRFKMFSVWTLGQENRDSYTWTTTKKCFLHYLSRFFIWLLPFLGFLLISLTYFLLCTSITIFNCCVFKISFDSGQEKPSSFSF